MRKFSRPDPASDSIELAMGTLVLICHSLGLHNLGLITSDMANVMYIFQCFDVLLLIPFLTLIASIVYLTKWPTLYSSCEIVQNNLKL